jgi:hypothetical protein
MAQAPKIQPLTGERQEKETDRMVMACNDFLRLGAGRSLTSLHENYLDKVKFEKGFKPPTTSVGTLYNWSSKFGWAERASAYDADWERRKTEESSNARNAGLALESERIKKLVRLANVLEAQIYKEDEFTGELDGLWVPDVKQIGSGDDAERIDIVRFNSGLITSYLNTLDDLAKETGGRVKKIDADFDGKLIIEWPEDYGDVAEEGEDAD